MLSKLVLAALACVVLASAAAASAAVGQRVFYLKVKPRQCLIGASATGNKGQKTVLIVPCSNPAHNYEVYGVAHGGWGHAAPPPANTAFATARRMCLALFQTMAGHALASPFGWYAFFADPGAETARYGDEIVCSLRTWPTFKALGAGWHVR